MMGIRTAAGFGACPEHMPVVIRDFKDVIYYSDSECCFLCILPRHFCTDVVLCENIFPEAVLAGFQHTPDFLIASMDVMPSDFRDWLLFPVRGPRNIFVATNAFILLCWIYKRLRANGNH